MNFRIFSTVSKLLSGRAWRIICAGVLIGAFSFSIVLNARLAKRITTLEALVLKREQADPLMPKECTLVEHQGESRENYCQVDLRRLLEAPQQFEGRWVMVRGYYLSGFEMSALFLPAHFEKMTGVITFESALWLNVGSAVDGAPREVTAVGKFKRGPAGHMWQYFGELEEVRLN